MTLDARLQKELDAYTFMKHQLALVLTQDKEDRRKGAEVDPHDRRYWSKLVTEQFKRILRLRDRLRTEGGDSR